MQCFSKWQHKALCCESTEKRLCLVNTGSNITYHFGSFPAQYSFTSFSLQNSFDLKRVKLNARVSRTTNALQTIAKCTPTFVIVELTQPAGKFKNV